MRISPSDSKAKVS